MDLLLMLYKQQLAELSQLLDSIGEKRLALRFARWACDLSHIVAGAEDSFKKHIARTKKVLSRMKPTDNLVAPPRRRPRSYLDETEFTPDEKLGHMLRELRSTLSMLQECGIA
jgi:hypothetical protein